MTVLVLDAALGLGGVGVCRGAALVASRLWGQRHGIASRLPAMVDEVLAEAGCRVSDVGLIAVTVGPGSFTGVRAALSLAHGLSLGSGRPLIGVTVGEALRAAHGGDRPVWVAIEARRDRIFLDRDGAITALAPADIPAPTDPIAVAGDAAIDIAARLAAQGHDVQLRDQRRPTTIGIALAARQRRDGILPPQSAQPLYVDPPQIGPAQIGNAQIGNAQIGNRRIGRTPGCADG